MRLVEWGEDPRGELRRTSSIDQLQNCVQIDPTVIG
jgi:hypothetical protein